MTTTVGRNLRAARGRLGLSQFQLGEEAGIGAVVIGAIGRGDTQTPRATTMAKLADALGTTVDELYGYESADQDKSR